MAHGRCQRGLYLKAAAEGDHGIGRGHAFGDALAHPGGLLDALALAQIESEGIVPAQRRSTGGHQVTDPGQTGKGLGLGSAGCTKSGEFSQSPGLDHGGRVLAVSGPARHSHGQCRDVLQGSAQFQTNHVVGHEGLEVVGGAGPGDPHGRVGIRAGHHGGTRLTRCHLLAQVGA